MVLPFLEQAREGDVEAIALFFNHVLEAYNQQVQVSYESGNLRLLMTGTPAAVQEKIMPVVLRGILTLHLTGLHSVYLAAQADGDLMPIWQIEVSGTQRKLLRMLAELGDEGAIAHLLTQAVAHKQIVVHAHLADAHLVISLEANPAPDQDIALTLLKRELAGWRTPYIQSIEVRGKEIAADVAWTASIAPTPSTRPPRSKPLSASVVTQTPKAPPAVWTFKFELPKLALIGFLLAYGLFCARHYNFSDFINGTNPLMMFIHGVNLIFHEAGHTIFSMFGQLVHLLAGSGMQILVPAVISGYFFFTRQPFAAAVALCWVGENFWDVSVYIKDAQERALPLLGGEGVLHDWHFILVILRCLDQDDAIGNTAFTIGTLIYGFAIFLGVFYAQIQPRPKDQSLSARV